MTALQRLALELLVAAAALVGCFAAGHHGGVKVGRAQIQQRWDAERAGQATAALQASERARAEETRRTAALQETAHVAQADRDRALSDAAAAAAAGRSLRARAAAVAARCGGAPGDPAAAPGSSTAAGPGLVLADVLGRLDDRAGQLAAYADAARIAGRACEASYDALTSSR